MAGHRVQLNFCLVERPDARSPRALLTLPPSWQLPAPRLLSSTLQQGDAFADTHQNTPVLGDPGRDEWVYSAPRNGDSCRRVAGLSVESRAGVAQCRPSRTWVISAAIDVRQLPCDPHVSQNLSSHAGEAEGYAPGVVASLIPIVVSGIQCVCSSESYYH